MDTTMDTPFLSVYTPTYRRADFLEKCKASIQMQTIADRIEHVIIYDHASLGVGGMFTDIKNHAQDVHGDYVFILSDDNVLYDALAVSELRDFIEMTEDPDVVIWRGIVPSHRTPTDAVWEHWPILGHIDLSNFIVRGDIWRAEAHNWKNDYAADFYFINHLFESGRTFTWFDRLGYQALAVMKGATQEEWEDAGSPNIMAEQWRKAADHRRQLSRDSR